MTYMEGQKTWQWPAFYWLPGQDGSQAYVELVGLGKATLQLRQRAPIFPHWTNGSKPQHGKETDQGQYPIGDLTCVGNFLT